LYFVGNFVTEIYFYHQEVLIYVLSMGVVWSSLFAFGFVIPWEAYLGNIYPALTEVSAISSWISLAPLFAFGLVIPWEAYLGNIYPALTEVSAISSWISLAPLFASGLFIPWEAYLGNIHPALTEVSAILRCISLAPFPPILSHIPIDQFTAIYLDVIFVTESDFGRKSHILQQKHKKAQRFWVDFKIWIASNSHKEKI